MVSEAEIERLRLEADTIMTRIERVQQRLEDARHESGDHWAEGTIVLTLDTPRGDSIEVSIEIDQSAAESAQRRYERVKELEAELERKQAVVGQLAPMPAEPLAYLICYHLDRVGGNYPRSMAGHLDARREEIVDLCDRMETAGLLERIEGGTVKQRQVKAKKADEVRQHHTYYRLSTQGDHLLRFLGEREGRENVLRHLPEGRRIAGRLARGGPDYPRMTAEELDTEFEHVRHCYRALQRVGLVTEYEGGTIKSSERKLKPKEETHRKHTYYVTTTVAEQLLREMD